MVVQKTINNLKAGPKEDKVAVASGIAISVVVVLLIGWAIYFLHSIASGSQQLKLGGGVQDQFNMTNVTQAQQELEAQFGSSTQEYQDIQQQSAAGDSGNSMQTQPMQVDTSGSDQFGSPDSSY